MRRRTLGMVTLMVALTSLATGCSDDPKVERLARAPFAVRPVVGASAPPCKAEADVFPYAADGETVECLELGDPVVDEKDVESASYDGSVTGQHAVRVTLTDEAAEEFDDAAAAWLDKRLAIVANGKVASAPVVHETEFGGELQITGPSEAEMRGLAAVLDRQQ